MQLDIEVNEHNVAMITVVSRDRFRFLGKTSEEGWQTMDRLTVLGIKETDRQGVIGGDRSLLEKYITPNSLLPGRFATANCVADADGQIFEEFFELPALACEGIKQLLNHRTG